MKTIGFIGLGLIGGSLAKTIRRTHPEIRLIAWDPEETALKQALSEGAVHKACPGITEDFAACDCIFLCTSSDAEELLPQVKAVMRPDALLSDTGSIRTGIREAVKAAGLDGCFIGGCPMAGSQKGDYADSTDRMFENAWYILTPGGDVPIRRVSAFSEFISSIGAQPAVMSFEEHDYVTAAVRHLPLILSASRINMIGALDSPANNLGSIAAGCSADMKELSLSSPEEWADLLLANSDSIIEILDAFTRKLTDFRFVIRNGDRKKLLQYLTDCRSFAERCCHTKDTED